jgi:hypothetical protein
MLFLFFIVIVLHDSVLVNSFKYTNVAKKILTNFQFMGFRDSVKSFFFEKFQKSKSVVRTDSELKSGIAKFYDEVN